MSFVNFTMASSSLGEFLSIWSCNKSKGDTFEILANNNLENSFKELMSH